MSEVELRFAFRELAEGVKARPEPYARLMARSRRRRFSRWITGCIAAVAAIVLAPVALNAASGPAPQLGPIDNNVHRISPWTRKLIDAPVRGGLAGDTAFVREVTQVLRSLDSGPMSGYPTKVLFAEDVGDKRVVVAVRYNATYQMGVIAAGPQGVDAAHFARASAGAIVFESLLPFTTIEFGFGVAQDLRHIGIALAPPGCAISVATQDSTPQQWRASGDYLAWSQSVADQLVRVTCATVMRYEGTLLDLDSMIRIPGEVRPHFSASGIDVPEAIVDQMVQGSYPPQAIGPLRVIFAGVPAGMTNPAYIAADPVDKGRWLVQVYSGSGSAKLLTTVDVLAAGAVVAVDNPDRGAEGLVVGPPSAVRLEIRDASSDALLETVALVNGAGSVLRRAAEDVVLRAFDASGALVGTGLSPLPQPPTPSEMLMGPAFENWN